MAYKLEADEQERKLFVGGLNKGTDDETLKQYFESYGDIVDCSIMRDQDKRSRGFGFILFDDAAVVDKIISTKKDGHVFSLDDHSIEIKRALPKVPKGSAGTPRSGGLFKKVFVGGLPNSVSEDDIRTYFEGFGRVNEVQLIKDRETGRLRGFAFVTFDEEDSADKCLQRRSHEICKKICEVKRAQTRMAGDTRPDNIARRGRQNQESAGAAAATGPLGINEVNRLIQQAFAMGQGVYQQPSMQPPTVNSLAAQPSANVLLQALMGQQVAPAPAPAPVAPSPPASTTALSQLAQLLQAGGIDANALGTLLKEPEAQRSAAAPATSMDVYSTPYSSYASQSSNYGPSKDEYSPSAKRAYRPY